MQLAKMNFSQSTACNLTNDKCLCNFFHMLKEYYKIHVQVIEESYKQQKLVL